MYNILGKRIKFIFVEESKMSEEMISLSKEQQKAKPKIEDVINEQLEGDRRQNALDFIAYLRENKLNPVWTATNAWWVNYKGKRLVSIRVRGINTAGMSWGYGLDPGSWHIGHWLQGFNFPDNLNDELKQFIWANMQPCKHCMCCAPGHSGEFLGKKFETVCYFRIENPDSTGLEFTKNLLECKKKAITSSI